MNNKPKRTKQVAFKATLPATHVNAFKGDDSVRCDKCGHLPTACAECAGLAKILNQMNREAK